MKRFCLIILCFALVLSLAGCGGSYGSVNLQEAVAIPENGIIKENTIKQLKEQNAIGTFQGNSNGFAYEWTIFGSDISAAEEINLKVDIAAGDDEVELHFAQTQPFAFPALLSVQLQEVWDAQSATAYKDNKAFCSVSLTGSKTTVLNLSVRDTLGTFVVIPDAPIVDIPPAAVTSEPIQEEAKEEKTSTASSYLSAVKEESGRVYSDGSATIQDKYFTDPVPEGKPMPVEPEDQQINTAKAYSCTFSIECSTILNNLSMLDSDKLECVPSNGVILYTTTVSFYDGESVFDVLQRVCRDKGIHMEASWTPIYNSAYVEGIHNLYEFDCGELSGWMYRVNGWYPNYGSSRYQLKEGDIVEWRYTCDLGNDVGGAYAVGG